MRDISVRKTLEKRNRLFLAATSHDIRNSLAGIVGYTNILTETLPAEDGRRELTRIASLGRTISDILNDIVVHAGAGAPDRVTQAPLSLRGLLIGCAKDIEAECRQKGLRLHLELPDEGTVLTDRVKLTRIVQNLLSNAVRYIHTGEIELRGEVTPSDFRVAVCDTGIGIEPSALPHVFAEYYRHEQTGEMEPLGTGLGLATVKRFCKLLGGTVTVASSPGQGTTVLVVLPTRDGS